VKKKGYPASPEAGYFLTLVAAFGKAAKLGNSSFECAAPPSKLELHHHIVHHVTISDVDHFFVDLLKSNPIVELDRLLIVLVDVKQQAFLTGFFGSLGYFEDQCLSGAFSLRFG
jgi:hypothetical protein